MTREFKLAMLCALLLVAFALRVWRLPVDPPSLDLLPDQAPWTDEGTISLPVVQAIRGGDFGGGTVQSGRPLHVLVLSTAFDLLGVGRFQGRIASVVIGLLGVVVLARVAAQITRNGALLALLFAGTGFFFVIYSRLILTEGLVAAALCLIVWFGIRARNTWQALAVGVALGAAAVLLKLHALALLPGLGLLYLLRRKRLLLPFLIGAGGVFLVWRAYWIPGNGSYVGYIQDRLGGDLLGMASPAVQALQIFMGGSPYYYLIYQIPLFLLASIEILDCILSPRRWLVEAPDSIVVALFWLIAVVIAVGLFRYTPPRYYHLASPALVLLGIAGARRLWEGSAFPRASIAVRLAAAGVLGLLFLVQFSPALPFFGGWALWVPLLGLPFPFIFLWLSGRTSRGWNFSLRTRGILLAGLIAFQVIEQAGLYAASIIPARMDLPDAAAALAETVPQNAVMVGRLAGTLALLAPLQGYPIGDRIDRDAMVQLAHTQSVWIVMLTQDEAADLDPRMRPSFLDRIVFPVDYSSKSQRFTVYHFSP